MTTTTPARPRPPAPDATGPQPGGATLAPVLAAGPVSTTLARRIRALHRIEATAVSGAVRIARAPRLVDVADAILDGLGKSPWVGGGHSSAASVVAQTGAWLEAKGVTDVIICDAELLPSSLAAQTCDWLAGLGIRAWYIYGTEQPVTAEEAAGIGADLLAASPYSHSVEGCTLDGLVAAWPGLADNLPPARRDPYRYLSADFPQVPRVDGLRFRSAARALLDPDDFAVVEARFLDSVSVTRAWCDTNPGGQAEKLLVQYRAMVNDCGGVDELLTVTRGFQVGAFNRDWGVSVHTARLVAAAATEPRQARSVIENWWARFGLYRTTETPALAVLYDAGLALAAIETLRVADLDWQPDAGHVSITPAGGEPLMITGERAPLLAAHLLCRQHLGAEPDDALFVTFRNKPVRSRTLGDTLLGPIGEIGVTVAPPPVRRHPYSATTWAARYGVTAFRLHKGAR